MPKRPQARSILAASALGVGFLLALAIAARVAPWFWWTDQKARVLAATGLDLTSLDGPKLTLFPRLGMTLDGVALGDPAPSSSPVATCARVEVRPRLLPLLLGRLELDLIRLDGLRLDLTGVGHGLDHWAGLPCPNSEPTSGQPVSGAPDVAQAANPNASLVKPAAPLLRGARVEVADVAIAWGNPANGRLAGLCLAQVSLQVRGSGGDLYLDHRVAAFYGGGLAGTLHLDLRGQDPLIDLDGAALDFQAEPLLRDLTGAAALSGRGDLTFKLATAGRGHDALVRGLGGSLALVLRDGALRGLDLSTLVAAARADPQVGQSPPFTSFTELRASAALTNGFLRSDDLVAVGPWVRLTGSGTLNLVDGLLDWRLAPVLAAPPQGGGVKELEGVPIPVYLGGTLSDPAWRVDVAAVLREVVRRRPEGRGGDVIERLERRTGVKGLDGILRGLLGR